MAAIIPNSEAQFFGDVGLSPTYEDTRYFPDELTKDSFFASIPHVTAQQCTYQRENANRIRVGIGMAALYNKQYMRFKNTSFEGKWFYAFIVAVNYINNATTEIEYQIDYVMTWMGSFTLSRCYVERQHSETDVIGENIIEENLDIGDYVYNFVERTGYLNDYDYEILIGASVDSRGQPIAGGEIINGVYSGIKIYPFYNVTSANDFIDVLTDKAKSDALVGAVMCPRGFEPQQDGSPPPAKLIEINKYYYAMNGYSPHNNKLFTYPYNFLMVTNGDGNDAIFRYEFFGATASRVCQFFLYGQPDLNPEFILEPVNYKTWGTSQFCTAEKMSLRGFPQCAFNIDQYKAFLAQNSSSLAADAISTAGSGIISTVVNAVTGNIGGAVQSALGTGEKIMRRAAMHQDYARKPPQSNGSTTGGIEGGRKLKDFYFMAKSITGQYARIIDEYFDMFGYAQNRVMRPNMHARPSWTYVKTIGCVVHCSAPAEDCRIIEECFDRGIRFWTSSVTVGDYSASNAAAT